MKTLAFLTAAALLAAAPALAQSNTGGQGGVAGSRSNEPVTQKGSGTTAGGPANELNPSAGIAPRGDGANAKEGVGTRGGQYGGGPANALNPTREVAPTGGTAAGTTAGQAGTGGQYGGGPRTGKP